LRDATLRQLELLGFDRGAAEWLWEKAPITLLLDSFDEVAQPESHLKRWIEDICQAARRPGMRILLCTRPYGYESAWVRGGVELDLCALTDPQAEDWLRRHGEILGSRTPSLAEIEERLDEELARTPILLLMAVVAWDQPRGWRQCGKGCVVQPFHRPP
jgi:hypothetical protein